MFKNGLDEQLRSTLAIFSSMSGLWLLGVIALGLAPSAAGSRDFAGSEPFHYKATGVTYAQQDVSGQFTIYIRGTQRVQEHTDRNTLAPASDPFESLRESLLHYRWTPIFNKGA